MKEEAWECYEEALQCDSLRERKRLLNEAIQFDPDFLDAKSESNNNLSDTDYKNILRTKGQEKLSNETKSIEVTVISNDYRNKWDLGDIVNIEDKESDILDKKMITEVEEVIENGTKTVYPTFGNPLPEKIELN